MQHAILRSIPSTTSNRKGLDLGGRFERWRRPQTFSSRGTMATAMPRSDARAALLAEELEEVNVVMLQRPE